MARARPLARATRRPSRHSRSSTRDPAHERPRGPGGSCNERGPRRDGVVAGDRPRIATAQHQREIARRAAPRGRRVRGRAREAPVVVGDEQRQEGVGGRACHDPLESELGGQPILQGAPEALDPAFGLRRAGADIPDAEVGEDLPQVGRVLNAAEFLLQRPMGIIAHEDRRAVAVTRDGKPRVVKTCSNTTA